jgi:HlyD family secretion protein
VSTSGARNRSVLPFSDSLCRTSFHPRLSEGNHSPYDRGSQLAEHGNASQVRLDQAADALHESQRATVQAKFDYEHRRSTATPPKSQISVANVQKAVSDITAVQSIIDQMVITAPVASQVYAQRGARANTSSPMTG